MINKIDIVAERGGKQLPTSNFLAFSHVMENSIKRISIECSESINLEKLYLIIRFSELPAFWRGSDYSWKAISTPYLTANYHSPKILKFADLTFVVGTTTEGCWEWDGRKQQLIWYLIHPDLNPTFLYNAEDKRDWSIMNEIPKGKTYSLGLYEGQGPVPEVARTPIGFVPTVAFTDHCDFDTPILLSKQREFFASVGIKTTKGVFLHTYSHQGEYAAMDQPKMKEEYSCWEEDGHELAYHAFSRSFREKSWEEFREFKSIEGFKPITTYIDHGYLGYNYTKQAISERQSWYHHMQGRGIDLIWNYLDVIEGNSLSNNQLSPVDSSIKAIRSAASYQKKNNLPVYKGRDIKTWLAYGTSENLDKGIKRFKTVLNQRKKLGSGIVLRAGAALILNLMDYKIWVKNILEVSSPFHFARFSPVFFNALDQKGTKISVFQTISVKDFVSVFSSPSIEKLKREVGLIIAHTYFAYLGDNHPGRMFMKDDGTLNPGSKRSLILLGNEVNAGQIWNPTVGELQKFHLLLQEVEFGIVQGKLCALNAPGAVRYIT